LRATSGMSAHLPVTLARWAGLKRPNRLLTIVDGAPAGWHARGVASTRAPLWTWAHRLEVLGYDALVVSGILLGVAAALDREWWKLVVLAVLVVVGAGKLVATVRGASVSQREAEERRRRAAENAVRAMTPARIASLVAERRLDVSTSAGRVALIKALRREDPRLGLVDAKTLADEACR